MKQVGLALHTYAGTHGMFPGLNGLTIDTRGPVHFYAHAYSPFARMLAELDEQPLYNATNFSPAATSARALQDNLTVMTMTVALFLCPEDGAGPPPGYGRVNLRFNQGATPWNTPSSWSPDSHDSPFTMTRFYAPADFRDGLSQTAGVSERLQGGWVKSRWSRGDYLLTSVGAGGLVPHGGADWALGVCAAAPAGTAIETRAGESWFLSGLHYTSYNHCGTPNAPVADCSLYDSTSGTVHDRTLHAGVMTARSGHRGGVNVMLMDGSVRFVKDAVGKPVWRALATRAGGEAIDADSF